jgi:ABC-2 type transport system permease protein
VRVYRSLALMTARKVLTYRLNFVIRQFALLFQLLAMLSVWGVLLHSGSSVAGFGWPQMKAYLVIAFGTSLLLSAYGDMEMGWRIREGLVAIDLTKPVDYQRARFAECIGGVVLELALVAGVVTVVALFTGGMAAPGAGQAALFAVSLLLVVPVKFGVLYLSSLMCFWTQNFIGLYMARLAIVGLFSGALVPLVLLPDGLRMLANVLPFAGITSTPALLYLGQVTGWEAAGLIGLQALWAVLLWFIGKALWTAALRQLTVHGG